MDTKELNKRIDALGKRNQSVKADIQALGLVCLSHIEEHGDVMPLNRLLSKLQKSQVRAFVEWTLAFGKVKRNTDKATKEAMPLAFDKTRTTDIEGATEKPWDDFAPSKAESVARAFDLQAEVLKVLKRAAEAGQPQSVIEALAKAAGVDTSKVPRSSVVIAAEVGEASM